MTPATATNVSRKTDAVFASSGTQYIPIVETDMISTVGMDSSPADTAMLPKMSAPTIDSAVPI